MKIVKNICLCFIMLIIFASMFPINAYAVNDPSCVTEAKAYYKEYGFDLDIKGCENKYTGTNADKYIYAVTYVTKGGEIMQIYLNEIPKDFSLWNTDIIISDGRVVVSGVNGDSENTWNIAFNKYKGLIIGVSGLGALSCVFAFVLTFIKMGSTAGSPNERTKFMGTLLFTGFGAVGLGAVVLIFGFFWNII